MHTLQLLSVTRMTAREVPSSPRLSVTIMEMSDPAAAPSPIQLLFNDLLDRRPFGDPWMANLWQAAARTRPRTASKQPASLGTLSAEDAPAEHGARQGKVFDRALAPSSAFLRWLLEHPEEMTVDDRDTFGARSEDVRSWRRRLFSDDVDEVSAAKSEGLRQLTSRLAQRGRNKWWLFEGFARVDACFVSDTAVLVVERWRDSLHSSSSRWYPQRVQLWRDVEAVREFAGSRKYGVVLAVDDEAQGVAALEAAVASMSDSFPHLVFEEQEKLERHLLGYVPMAALEDMSRTSA
jgi:hypothetical protein